MSVTCVSRACQMYVRTSVTGNLDVWCQSDVCHLFVTCLSHAHHMCKYIVLLTHRRGANGMLPIHMACLSGYADCAENLIKPGECGGGSGECGGGSGECGGGSGVWRGSGECGGGSGECGGGSGVWRWE